MNKKLYFLFPLMVLLIIQIACGSSPATISTATSPSERPIEDSLPTKEIETKPTDTPTTAPTIRPTPTAELGTRRDNPAPAGSTVTIDGMEIVVTSIVRPADSIVRAGNSFNTDPDPGKEYIFVEMSIKCVKESTEACSISSYEFKMVGSLGIKYDREWFLSGVKGLLEDTEFYGGTQVTGNVAFIIGIDEKDLILIHEPFFENPTYLSIE